MYEAGVSIPHKAHNNPSALQDVEKVVSEGGEGFKPHVKRAKSAELQPGGLSQSRPSLSI